MCGKDVLLMKSALVRSCVQMRFGWRVQNIRRAIKANIKYKGKRTNEKQNENKKKQHLNNIYST